MNKHAITIVPTETWLYHSPKLKLKNLDIDIGLVCESLIYYDTLFIAINNNWSQFNKIIKWFKINNAYRDFLELLDSRIINFVFRAFYTYPVFNSSTNTYSIWNIDDEESKKNDVFIPRILYNKELNHVINAQDRERLCKKIKDSFVELKANKFKDAIKNARTDYQNPEQCKMLVQSFIDELYTELGYKKSPVVNAKVEKSPEDKINITWNINFDEINQKTERKLNLRCDLPLAGIADCNNLIETALLMEADLYLGNVMSSLVNNKLLEINMKNSKISQCITELNQKVELPKLSELVNNNQITFKEIIRIRSKAKKFRRWLQQEGDRDRDAIIAYHNELARETKLTKFGFGLLSITGATIGGAIGSAMAGPIGGALGGATGHMADKFISSFNKEWKPMIFGEWLTKYIDDKK